LITLNDIELAKKNLSQIIAKTPLAFSSKLSQSLGCNIYLKEENLQNTGSFKLRGAFNRISNLTENERKRGVVAASAGNHAQGVALSGQFFNIPTTIIMPENTPLTKVNGVKSYGAQVILHGSFYDDAYQFAIEYAEQRGNIFIHPFENDDVIAGQGTIALEIFESGINFDAIIVPIGGGGLISGISTAIKSIRPNTKIIGVASSGAIALKKAFETGEKNSSPVKTIADGIAVRDSSNITLKYMKKYVDEVVEVDDEEIAGAILFLLENQKIIVEGAGAVGVASLLYNKIDLSKYKNIATVVSGGNIDVTMLSVIIEKGLLKSDRKMKLIVTLIDKNGSLMELTKIFHNLNANIVQIDYDRTSISISYGDANVSIDLEIKGELHRKEIEAELQKSGYKFKVLK
jgi:threonine dehydratase